MSARDLFTKALDRCPLVAILRGVRPFEVVAIADMLVESGFTMIEVPLNSPEPLVSIALIARRYDPSILIGAGTVLDAEQVREVEAAGGRLIVSPNINVQVIAASAGAGIVTLPGYATPTEAFTAIEAGASGLKLFPAEAASPAVLKAQKAVLPKDVPVLVVGGIQPDNTAPWTAAGANGFGLGSGLYAPGMSAADVAERALRYREGLVTR